MRSAASEISHTCVAILPSHPHASKRAWNSVAQPEAMNDTRAPFWSWAAWQPNRATSGELRYWPSRRWRTFRRWALDHALTRRSHSLATLHGLVATMTRLKPNYSAVWRSHRSYHSKSCCRGRGTGLAG